MDVAIVDPRDVSWEKDVDVYRVYFWSLDGTSCSEYELSDVPDVQAVLSWADANALGRVSEILAYLVCDGEPGLARLAGGRPNDI